MQFSYSTRRLHCIFTRNLFSVLVWWISNIDNSSSQIRRNDFATNWLRIVNLTLAWSIKREHFKRSRNIQPEKGSNKTGLKRCTINIQQEQIDCFNSRVGGFLLNPFRLPTSSFRHSLFPFSQHFRNHRVPCCMCLGSAAYQVYCFYLPKEFNFIKYIFAQSLTAFPLSFNRSQLGHFHQEWERESAKTRRTPFNVTTRVYSNINTTTTEEEDEKKSIHAYCWRNQERDAEMKRRAKSGVRC